MSIFADGEEPIHPPLEAADQLGGLDGLPIGPRDFVVVPEDGPLEVDYHVGRVPVKDTGLISGVVSVAVLEGKLLVALPEGVWNRSPAKRLLASRSLISLIKPVLCEVAACHIEERDVVLTGVFCKAWIGFVSKELEQEIDFVSEESLVYDFNPDGEEGLLPTAVGLLEVAKEHFSFVTAESAVPECPPSNSHPHETRLQNLEKSLGQIQANLDSLVGHLAAGNLKSDALGSSAKSKAKEKKTRRPPDLISPDIPGLDKEAVQAALQAGVPLQHLQEVGAVLKGRPKRLEELPRKKGPSRAQAGPLNESPSESEEEDAELLPDGGMPATMQGTSQLEQAVLQLSSIAKHLAAPKEKKDKIEVLLDNGGGLGQSSESSTGTSSRKNSVAMRALQRLLVEDPKYIYQVLEANLQSDFGSRPIQRLGSP